MKHKNNHARSRQKRKKLRLKNRLVSIQWKRSEKEQKEFRPKGVTIRGNAYQQAKKISAVIVNEHGKMFRSRYRIFMDNEFCKTLNQRQRRKRAAQNR